MSLKYNFKYKLIHFWATKFNEIFKFTNFGRGFEIRLTFKPQRKSMIFNI